MSLVPILETVIGNLRSGRLEREEDVKIAVILPLLQALGWNTVDTDSFRPEYPAGPGRVDYALLSHGRPQAFIEAKRRGALDVRAEAQLFGYASNNGVPLLVLSDGYCWDFYLSMADGPPEARRFQRLELRDAEGIPEYADILETCLRKQRVASGEARRNAETRLESDRNRKTAREAIPEAWGALLTEPDELLCELLAEQVQHKTGINPEPADVENFLRTLPLAPLQPSTAQRPPIRQSDPLSGEPRRKETSSASESKSASFEKLRRGTTGVAPSPPRNGSRRKADFQAIVRDLMRAVLETHPEILDEEAIRYLENKKDPFGTKLGYPLIRKISDGRQFSGHSRYWKDTYAGRWYVCSQWWSDKHSHNAMKLAEWVKLLTARSTSPEARNCLEGILNRFSSWKEKQVP